LESELALASQDEIE
jgi:hypothetical protein